MKSFIINMALGFMSSMVQALGIPTLEEFAVAIGRCFGPKGVRHWSELTPDEQSQWFQRVPVLRTLHTDYLKPFQWVPRTLTFYAPSAALDFPPPMLSGNDTGFADIPPAGQWVGSEGYIGVTTTTGFHVRFGFRPDLVDKYYDFPSIAAKQV